jgi:hypothetical protein
LDAADGRLFDAALLFRTRLKPLRTALKFGERGWKLPEEATLPALGSEVSGQRVFATLKMAISDQGMFFQTHVAGKRQLPWCRESRVEDSDGLHVWIDTRHARGSHRATKYCHRFGFSPMGRGPKNEQPFGAWAPINRARENSPPPPEKLIFAEGKLQPGGYELSAALPWQALHGLSRDDFPVIGLYMAVIDRELGNLSLGVGLTLLAAEDPDLWLEADISRDAS